MVGGDLYMNKECFLKLTIEDKVMELNKVLESGKTVSEIRKEWGISEKLLQRVLREGKYKFDHKEKQYKLILDSDNYDSNKVVVVNKEKYKSNDNVVISKNEYDLLIRKVDEMYKWFECQTNIVEVHELKIPVNNNKAVTRSFKVYEDILEQFTEYCRSHNNYKVQDIVTLALKELMEKYK